MPLCFEPLYKRYCIIAHFHAIAELCEHKAYVFFTFGCAGDKKPEYLFIGKHACIELYPVAASPHSVKHPFGSGLFNKAAHEILEIKVYQHHTDIENNVHHILLKLNKFACNGLVMIGLEKVCDLYLLL